MKCNVCLEGLDILRKWLNDIEVNADDIISKIRQQNSESEGNADVDALLTTIKVSEYRMLN